MAVCALLFTVVALPQVNARSSIRGVVRDSEGLVLPGVTVTLMGANIIGGERVAVTDGRGSYVFVGLPPGIYDLRFELAGFSSFYQEGVELASGSTVTLHVTVEIASVAETITVTSSGDLRRVERYPKLECPDEIPAQQEFALQVSLTTEPIGEEDPLTLDLPDALEWNLDVVVSAPGFVIKDGINKRNIVMRQDEDSTPALFELTPKPMSAAQETRRIYVTFWHKGSYLARASRDLIVYRTRDAARNEKPEAAESLTVASASTPNVPTRFDLTREGTNLTLLVTSHETEETASLIVMTQHFYPSPEDFSVSEDILRWIEASFSEFAAHSSRGITPVGRRREATVALMRAFGRELYQKVAPEQFKEAFWRLKDELGDEFQSIQIISDIPDIPWELMRPVRENGKDEQDFLGIDFRIARWHLNHVSMMYPSPPQQLPMMELAAIVPDYSGSEHLPAQTKELQALETVEGYRAVRGRLESVEELLADPPEGFVHFAGHGTIVTKAGIDDYLLRLEDVDIDVLTFRGLFDDSGQVHPFIFLNACHLGQAQSIANFVNGWAPAVLEGGGSGYVGGMWPLGDSGAAEMATVFYKDLELALADGPVFVSDLLRKTRRMFYETKDPTFLAYVYYGDPNLIIYRE
jgi:hypothetical protein